MSGVLKAPAVSSFGSEGVRFAITAGSTVHNAGFKSRLSGPEKLLFLWCLTQNSSGLEEHLELMWYPEGYICVPMLVGFLMLLLLAKDILT